MRLPVALVALACTALVACGDETPRLSFACTEDRAAVREALAAAPGEVRLEDGTRLSACVDAARSDAQLQTLGLLLTELSDGLAVDARDGDAEAAVQLGYLGGAVRRGAETNHPAQELARRVARSSFSVADAPAAVRDAVERGRAAGQATG